MFVVMSVISVLVINAKNSAVLCARKKKLKFCIVILTVLYTKLCIMYIHKHVVPSSFTFI